jgi:hypothetical protein
MFAAYMAMFAAVFDRAEQRPVGGSLQTERGLPVSDGSGDQDDATHG